MWIEAERARQRHLDGSKNGADITNSGQYKDSRAELTSAQSKEHYNVMPETKFITKTVERDDEIQKYVSDIISSGFGKSGVFCGDFKPSIYNIWNTPKQDHETNH